MATESGKAILGHSEHGVGAGQDFTVPLGRLERVQFCAPHFNRLTGKMEHIQKSITRAVKGFGNDKRLSRGRYLVWRKI